MTTSVTSEQWARMQGQSVFDNSGQKIGDIQRVFFNQTDEPTWAAVRGGLFGTREKFVPLAGSRVGPSGLAVAVGKDVVRDSPAIETGNELTVGDADRLNRYYEGMMSAPMAMETATPMEQTTTTAPAAPPATATRPTMTGPPPSAPTRSTAENQGAELTTYEEQIRVGTEAVESGSVRLHKYVVTEPVETTVPIRHEEVRVERMPAASSGPVRHKFGEETAEVTLHEERPTIMKETVPVETVRLATETQTDQRRVSDEVRKERIEVEDQRGGTGGMRRR